MNALKMFTQEKDGREMTLVVVINSGFVTALGVGCQMMSAIDDGTIKPFLDVASALEHARSFAAD